MCDPELIACQIKGVSDAIGSWNWNSFVATVLATSLGGFLGLVGVWWGFKLQRRHRDDEALTESVVKAMEALSSYARSARAHHHSYIRAAADSGGRATGWQPPAPDQTAVTLQLVIAEVRARRKADQDLMSEAGHSWGQICEMLDWETQAVRCGVLVGALADWRSRKRARSAVLLSIHHAGRRPVDGPDPDPS